MSFPRRAISLVALLCILPLIASADVLMLKNGQAITGKFQGADQTSVNFSVNGQTRQYRISQINSITFTSEPTAAASTRQQAGSSPATAGLQQRSEPASRPSATYERKTASTPARNITIPAGSIITVRMTDPVDSATDQLGQTYRASLDEPLMVNGRIVVPRGADVTAKLVSKAEAGRIKGRSELSLVLMDITINGMKYPVSTSEVTESGASRGKQTATRAGIGAILGATIGAIAGGGKGAAIGAATGAGAGTAIQIATHGEQVKIPPETRLDFTLAQPLNF